MNNPFLLVLLVMLTSQESALLAQTNPVASNTLPLICGHRGGFYADYPENSISAFEYTFSHASALPIIIEFDVRRSKQGTLFIIHDNALERTTSGMGNVNQQTDEYLLSLVLKNADGEFTKERIPTFEQVLDYAATRNLLLMLDIKEDVWEEALKLVGNKKLGSKCIVLTFNKKDTNNAYRLLPDAKISYLDDSLNEREEALKMPINNRVAYVTSQTTKKRIEELNSAGVLIMADVSEHNRNEGKPFQKSHYQDQVKYQKLSILITDFPLYLDTIFNK